MLNRPEEKKSNIEISDAQQRELDMQLMKQWTKLTVFEVGDEVDTINAGDKVYVYVNSLANAEVLEVDGSKKMIVSLPEIVVVW